MFGGTLLSNLYIAAAAVAGFAAGAMLSRLLGSFANRPMGKRADDLHHRIRGLEADLRVAQRTADQARTEREALSAELASTAAELVALRDRSSGSDERIRKLKAEVQHECGKTARLRQELVATHGVYTMTPQDHNGLDNRARTMIRIDNGKWVPAK